MSDRPGWIADRSVDIASAAEALARHLPVRTHAARRVGQGWDNVVLDVHGVFLRVSVREVADAGVRMEQSLLPSLSGLCLPVPSPIAMGEAEPGLPGPWMAYRPVPGRELSSLLAEGGTLAKPAVLGRFLRELHDLDMRVGHALPIDPMRRADPDGLAGRVHEWLDKAAVAGLQVPRDEALALVRETELGPSPMRPCIVHGDLHIRHVLVGDDDAVSGVIDWGDLCIAPPLGDLALLWCALHPEQRPELVATYGPVDLATLAASRRWAAFSSLALICASHALGDSTVLSGAREALRRTLRGPLSVCA